MQAAADPSPPPSNLDDTARAVVERALLKYQQHPGPLLQVLHAIQAALGYVPAAAVQLIAAELNLSRAEVHGVITFYHHFRGQPPGRHVLQLCQAEACRAMHCEQLTAHVKNRLQLDWHRTSG